METKYITLDNQLKFDKHIQTSLGKLKELWGLSDLHVTTLIRQLPTPVKGSD